MVSDPTESCCSVIRNVFIFFSPSAFGSFYLFQISSFLFSCIAGDASGIYRLLCLLVSVNSEGKCLLLSISGKHAREEPVYLSEPVLVFRNTVFRNTLIQILKFCARRECKGAMFPKERKCR